MYKRIQALFIILIMSNYVYGQNLDNLDSTNLSTEISDRIQLHFSAKEENSTGSRGGGGGVYVDSGELKLIDFLEPQELKAFESISTQQTPRTSRQTIKPQKNNCKIARFTISRNVDNIVIRALNSSLHLTGNEFLNEYRELKDILYSSDANKPDEKREKYVYVPLANMNLHAAFVNEFNYSQLVNDQHKAGLFIHEAVRRDMLKKFGPKRIKTEDIEIITRNIFLHFIDANNADAKQNLINKLDEIRNELSESNLNHILKYNHQTNIFANNSKLTSTMKSLNINLCQILTEIFEVD